MAHYKIKKGLDLNQISLGKPKQKITNEKQSKSYGLLGDDYPGIKPTFLVKEGSNVIAGDGLFIDKKMPSVCFTSPISGRVEAIQRGERRAFQAIVIKADGKNKSKRFKVYNRTEIKSLKNDKIKAHLLKSGLWIALRSRPFAKIANPDHKPTAIFVTAMETDPFAADSQLVISKHPTAFQDGLTILSKLTGGLVHVCKAIEKSKDQHGMHYPSIPHGNETNIINHVFEGPHPAGLVGTHIHFIEPVNLNKKVWYINYQDVIAIGKLFTLGTLFTERLIALGGLPFKNPRIIKAQLGSAIEDITQDELDNTEEHRLISGSFLSGREVIKANRFLGRYHSIVTALVEDRKRIFKGYLRPGVNSFSVKNIFLSSLFSNKKYRFTTNANGSKRHMVPIGSYEKVMPLDILPTFLLRALLSNDLEKAELLGALELDDEDLALCSFVCPGKQDYGILLRSVLDKLEKDLT